MRRTMNAAGMSAALGVTVVLLTGCTGGVSPTTTGGSSAASSAASPSRAAEADAESSGIESCMIGEWQADVADLAIQLGEQMTASGVSVAASDGIGEQRMSFRADGTLHFATDMTFVLSVDLGDGTLMTMTQHHTGDVAAAWEWSGEPTADTGLLGFSDFDSSGYNVQSTIEVDGVSSDAAFTPPNMAAADVPTRVSCANGMLTTHPEGTPFATSWLRAR